MKKIIFSGIFVLILTFGVFAGSAGRNAGEVLLVQPHANVNASGNAGVGLHRANWQFVHLNPAYLSLLNERTVGFSYNKYIESMSQSSLGLVNELKTYRYYFGVNYFDYGTFNRTTYSNFDSTDKFSAKSFVIENYYSAPAIQNIYTGIGIKYYYEKLDNYTGTAFAVDIGGLYLLESYPAALGFSIQNIGTKIKYQSRNEDLPLTVRLGASYYAFNERLGLFVDVEQIINQDMNVLFGSELIISDNFTVRAGFDGANDIAEGFTLGADFDIMNGFALSYAYVPNNDFDISHKLTLTYQFDMMTSVRPELRREQTQEYAQLLKLHEELLRNNEIDFVSRLSSADIIYYNLAILHYQKGNYRKALESINEIQDFDEASFDLKSAILRQLKR